MPGTSRPWPRRRYGDHPDTFLMTAPGDTSATTGDEAAAQSAPFTVTLDSPADFGRWGPVFPMRSPPRLRPLRGVRPGPDRLHRWGDRPEQLRAGQPVHHAEVWDPGADPGPIPEPTGGPPPTPVGSWTTLASEDEDRCYHSTAVLLPDGRVLSAGGGEFRPIPGYNQPPNDAIDSHRTGQIYSPPYLFKGPRPLITSAPASVGYRETFDVAVDTPNEIARLTWVRPSSVTHSLNTTQRNVELSFSVQAGILKVVAPDSPQHAVPGHYLLFVLNAQGVPSVAKIVHIAAPAPAVINGPAAAPEWLRVPMATPDAPVTKDTRLPLAPDALRVVGPRMPPPSVPTRPPSRRSPDFARNAGLNVESADAARRTVTVSAPPRR